MQTSTKIERPFIQRGVKLKIGADKVQRGARQWQANAAGWFALYGKVPADVYEFIDAAVKELASGTRDWSNFLKGKGQTRVTDRLIHNASVRIENVMFLAHALKELGDNPRFVSNGRAFVRDYIAAKTAAVPPFLLPSELVPNAKRVGAAIYAEASGGNKATALLKANSDGVRQWLRAPEKPFTKQPQNQYQAVPLFTG